MMSKTGVRYIMGVVLTVSMGVTEVLLLAEGHTEQLLPLHLCSLSGIAAAILAFAPRRILLEFLWYLGMPGALLALIFPAPAVSRFQALLTGSYTLTHLLIILIPAYMMHLGARVRKGRGLVMLLALQGIALIAHAANRALDSNYLFLSAPASPSPLEIAFVCGYPVYLITLESVMILTCLLMEKALEKNGLSI